MILFSSDEDIRSDKDLAEDYRRGMEAQDRMIEQYQKDNDALRAEVARLKEWVPHPSDMIGWSDPSIELEPGEKEIVREACEIHKVEVPEHLR